jgi:hypothetical protein
MGQAVEREEWMTDRGGSMISDEGAAMIGMAFSDNHPSSTQY